MKTLIFRNAANTTRVEVQADIFQTVAEIQEVGFDVKFTAMHIQDTDRAIAMGINVNELDYSYAEMVSMADSISGIGMFISEEQADSPGVSKHVVELSGTSGSFEFEFVDLDGSFQTVPAHNFAFNLNTTASTYAADQSVIDKLAEGGITVSANNEFLTFKALSSTPMMQAIATLDPSAIELVVNASGDLGAASETFSVVSYDGEVLIVEA